MTQMTGRQHGCYRCHVHEVQGPFRQQGHAEAPALESLETTAADDGERVFFASGYSAREIAQRHARETGGRVYVNTISRRIMRPELTVPVSYAVARRPVYTLRGPDEHHDAVYRAYWPEL